MCAQERSVRVKKSIIHLLSVLLFVVPAFADYVLVSGGAVTNGVGTTRVIYSSTYSSFTLEAWVKPTSDSGQQNIITQYPGTGRVMFCTNNGYLSMFNGDSSKMVTTDFKLPLNQWTHVAVARSKTEMTFFANGKAVASYTYEAGYKDLPSKSNLNIAAPYVHVDGTFSASFAGSIADVRAWGKFRTEQEITSDYQRRLSGDESGLLVYVPFNWSERSEAKEYVAGRTVAVGDYYRLADDPTLKLTSAVSTYKSSTLYCGLRSGAAGVVTDISIASSDFTLETWCSTALTANMIAQYVSTGVGKMSFGVDGSGYLVLSLDGQSHKSTKAVVAKQKWVHIAVTKTNDRVCFYANGESAGEVATKYTGALLNTALEIGNAGGTSQVGFLRDVRVWDVARTAEAIKDDFDRQLSGKESNLIGYWPLTEQAGSKVKNWVTGTECALPTCQTWWSGDLKFMRAPVLGKSAAATSTAVAFAGTTCSYDGRIGQCTVADCKRAFAHADFSWEAWVLPYAYEFDKYPVLSQWCADGNFQSVGDRAGMFLRKNDGGSFVVAFALPESKTGDGWVVSGQTPIPIGRWTHIAAVRKSGFMKLFVNGVEDAEASVSSARLSGISSMQIGATLVSQNSFDGAIAEVRVWDMALSDRQVARFWSRQCEAPRPDQTACWNLSEDMGCVLRDKVSGVSGRIVPIWAKEIPVPFTGVLPKIGFALLLR